MNWQKPMLLGLIGFLPCAFLDSLTCAQDATPKPKPDALAAADDDFRPLLPQAKPGDEGPPDVRQGDRPGGPPAGAFGGPPGFYPGAKPGERPGTKPREGNRDKGGFGRPGPSDGFQPGEPHGGIGSPMGPPGQGMMPGMPLMPGQGMIPGKGMMPGQGMMPGPGMMPLPPRWPHSDWQSLEKNDPEMYKLLKADADLDRQSQELAVQYRQAPKDQQGPIKERLEKAVTEHFEARQQRRLLELKRLEEELNRLRESIDKRKEAQQQIVNRRVSELLGVQDEPQF